MLLQALKDGKISLSDLKTAELIEVKEIEMPEFFDKDKMKEALGFVYKINGVLYLNKMFYDFEFARK